MVQFRVANYQSGRLGEGPGDEYVEYVEGDCDDGHLAEGVGPEPGR